jgi:hypothetical protein
VFLQFAERHRLQRAANQSGKNAPRFTALLHRSPWGTAEEPPLLGKTQTKESLLFL